MLYIIAVIFPPLAVLLTGRIGTALLNFVLWFFLFIPGMIHAIFVVSDHNKKKGNGTRADEMNSIVNDFLDNGITDLEPVEKPFKLKKGEELLLNIPADMWLYKRTGNYGQQGFGLNIKIIKGLRYRANVGQFGMSQDWRQDETGNLVITSQRVVFVGTNKNVTTQLHKVITVAFDENIKSIAIGRETGGEWIFKFDHVPMRNLAAAYIYLKGLDDEIGQSEDEVEE